MITVNFTKNQAQVLLQLLDLTVKTNGLSVAEAAVVLSKIIEDGIRKEAAPAPSEPESGKKPKKTQ